MLGRAVLAVLAVAFAVLPGRPAPPVSTPIHDYADAVRHTVWVDTGQARVAADVIRPRTARRVPVIMVASPYNTTLGRGNEHQKKSYDVHGAPTAFPLFLDNYFVPRGYAVVHVDLPGTGRSTGCLDVGGPGEVGAARSVIDWLNGRATGYTSVAGTGTAEPTWTTGDVGMIGKSWDGTIAIGVAGTGVEGLRTIVPIGAISSWYDYYRANGAALASGTPAALAAEVESASCPYPGLAAPPLDPGAPVWRERDYRPSAASVRASVFAVHGLAETNVRSLHFGQWWPSLTVPRRVWLSQTGHADPFDFRRAEWVAALHQWFDHYLLGVPNDVPTGAAVERAPDVWTEHPAWPAATDTVALRPRPDGSLGETVPPSTASFDDDQGSVGEWVAGPGPSSLVFRTPPLEADTRLSGVPELRLAVRADRPGARVSAYLVAYGPATIRDPVDEGIVTGSTRSCWGQSTSADSACYLDTAPATIHVTHTVLAGAWAAVGGPLTLTLDAVDAVIPRGHRVGLVIGGTDRDVLMAGSDARLTVDLAETVVRLPVVDGPWRRLPR